MSNVMPLYELLDNVTVDPTNVIKGFSPTSPGWYDGDGKETGCTDQYCSYCSSLGYTWVGEALADAPTKKVKEYLKQRASDYNTQKARGVHAIKRGAFKPLLSRYGLLGEFPTTLYTLPSDGKSLASSLFAGPYPKEYFARPCPTVPRHGFVESRVVRSKEELQRVIKETLAQDENGEVLVMPVLTGAMSAVAHNAGVTWGMGNDGVTNAGHYNQFVPCPCSPETWKDILFRQGGTMGTSFYDTWEADMKDAVPYIELVEHKGNTIPVQVRAGPIQSTASNFIPRETVVKQVIVPNIYSGDTASLLAWEKLVKEHLEANNGPEGLVVYHKGLSLASHWAIHAIQADIAVVTTGSKPKTGDVLKPESVEVPKLTAQERELLAKCIRTAQAFDIAEFPVNTVIGTAMAACHGMTFWGGKPALNNLRAAAVEMVTRFITAACLGEARHFYTCGPGRNGEPEPDPYDYADEHDDPDYKAAYEAWEAGLEASEKPRSHLPWKEIYGLEKKSGINRASVYRKMLLPCLLPQKRRELLVAAAKDFRTKGWSCDGDDDQGCSYGGPKWARVCDAGIALIDATEAFLRDSSRTNWDALQVKINYACHVAHNGGNVLTKWLRAESLDFISKVPTLGLMNFFAGWLLMYGFTAYNPNSSEE